MGRKGVVLILIYLLLRECGIFYNKRTNIFYYFEKFGWLNFCALQDEISQIHNTQYKSQQYQYTPLECNLFITISLKYLRKILKKSGKREGNSSKRTRNNIEIKPKIISTYFPPLPSPLCIFSI